MSNAMDKSSSFESTGEWYCMVDESEAVDIHMKQEIGEMIKSQNLPGENGSFPSEVDLQMKWTSKYIYRGLVILKLLHKPCFTLPCSH